MSEEKKLRCSRPKAYILFSMLMIPIGYFIGLYLGLMTSNVVDDSFWKMIIICVVFWGILNWMYFIKKFDKWLFSPPPTEE